MNRHRSGRPDFPRTTGAPMMANASDAARTATSGGRPVKYYSLLEERLNIASHALGLLLSIAALPALVARALSHGDGWQLASFSVFAISMIALYAASTAYHLSREPALRSRLRTVDHASIYLLIAGTYTPFALVTLRGPVGWAIFGVTWGMAVTGIALKLFFTGRFELASTLVYIFMGWLIVFFIGPLMDALPVGGMLWLLAGGVAYTLGAVLYSIGRVPLNHALFHLFVLAGSMCHFVAVSLYVLPRA
jgi:hemolysin III